MKETANGLRVGDNILYETVEDPTTGKTHFIPGIVTQIVSPDELVFKQHMASGSGMKVNSEWCHIDEDAGKVYIPAHQRGGEIIDEVEIENKQEPLDFTGSTNDDR
jgi:hypothetical protein